MAAGIGIDSYRQGQERATVRDHTNIIIEVEEEAVGVAIREGEEAITYHAVDPRTWPLHGRSFRNATELERQVRTMVRQTR